MHDGTVEVGTHHLTHATPASERHSRWVSFRWRLTVLIAVLAAIAVAVFAGIAYREVRNNVVRAAAARSRDVADRLASLFAQSTHQRLVEIREAASRPAVVALLEQPAEATRRAAIEALAEALSPPGAGPQHVEIWSAGGDCLAAAALSSDADATAACGARPLEPGILPLIQRGARFVGATAVPISGASTGVGYLVVERPVSVGPNAGVLNQLIGDGVALRVGNRRGDAWTDFTQPAQTPPIDLGREGVATYTAGGDARLGALSYIRGTPWAVWIEFPLRRVLAPAQAFLRRMIAVAAAVISIGVIVIWVFAGRITAPIDALTKASEAIAGGDFGRRVEVTTRDEVGRLGAAFNTMADRVAGAYQDLEERVRQRTARLEETTRMLEQHARESREARDELDRFFSLSLDLLCIADVHGRFVRVNPAWERVLGWTLDELTASPYDAFIHPDDRAATAAKAASLAAGETVVHFENRYRHRDGSYRWLSWMAAAHAERGLIYAAARDVTDDKRLARERDQHVEALNAVNQELEAFSYSVSHDLRAPLRHITGFAALLTRSSEGRLDADSRRYLDVIVEAAVKMGHLIDDLLAFSRVGRTPLTRTRVDLRQLVGEAKAEVMSEADGRVVRWTIGELPEVQGDPALLRLVLVNLLSNAVKYTGTRADAAIEIGAMAVKHDEVTLFVRDNGVGFDMQYGHKLFGVFQRLHSSDQFDGTGIGLATVRRIVQRHGGRVWAEGRVDAGATFYVALPSAPEDHA